MPIYDPYVAYGPGLPAYRPFYWYPPGYVAVGVIGFGAPFAVGAALWAHYNWESRHVDINVVNYNRFNRTNIVNNAANMTWQHDPAHRGTSPTAMRRCSRIRQSRRHQQRQRQSGALKSNITNPVNLKGGTVPLNNNAITNLKQNGGLKGADLKVDKGADLKVDKGADLKGRRTTDLKVDKNIKLNENPNLNTGNKASPKVLDRRVNVDTTPKINANPVVRSNPVSTGTPKVNVQNVSRNVSSGGGGGGGGGAGKVALGKKKPSP